MASLLDALLDEPVDNGTSLFSCVCVCCGPPSLLALSRCGKRLRQAVAAPLQQAERESAAMVSEHIGDTLEQLAAANIVTWRSGLPLAQCRHLGAWLQTGGPLEGVTTLRLLYSGEEDDSDDEDAESDDEDAESDDVVEVDLTPLRTGKTTWGIYVVLDAAEMMTVLARIITFHSALTTLK